MDYETICTEKQYKYMMVLARAAGFTGSTSLLKEYGVSTGGALSMKDASAIITALKSGWVSSEPQAAARKMHNAGDVVVVTLIDGEAPVEATFNSYRFLNKRLNNNYKTATEAWVAVPGKGIICVPLHRMLERTEGEL
jgi:hypothetical protein